MISTYCIIVVSECSSLQITTYYITVVHYVLNYMCQITVLLLSVK